MSFKVGSQNIAFLCLWDSRATQQHFVKKDWARRTSFELGDQNVSYALLVEPEKILLPPLHNKLELMKYFIKAMDKESESFNHLRELLPQLSEAKFKAGIFTGPDIRKVIRDPAFEGKLNQKDSSGGGRL